MDKCTNEPGSSSTNENRIEEKMQNKNIANIMK